VHVVTSKRRALAPIWSIAPQEEISVTSYLQNDIQYSSSKVTPYLQGPPANRAIWQGRFSIFSVSGEGE